MASTAAKSLSSFWKQVRSAVLLSRVPTQYPETQFVGLAMPRVGENTRKRFAPARLLSWSIKLSAVSQVKATFWRRTIEPVGVLPHGEQTSAPDMRYCQSSAMPAFVKKAAGTVSRIVSLHSSAVIVARAQSTNDLRPPAARSREAFTSFTTTHRRQALRKSKPGAPGHHTRLKLGAASG